MTGYQRAVLLALLVLGAAAVAPGRTAALLVPRLHPVMTKARWLVSAPIGNGFFVHVWAAPSTTGGICRFSTVDHHVAALHPSSWPPSGGGGCSFKTSSPWTAFGHPFRDLSLNQQTLTRGDKHAKWVPPFVEGELATAAVPARVVARWDGGSDELQVRGDSFAGGSPSMYGQTFSSLTLVAYDRHGHVIARLKTSAP